MTVLAHILVAGAGPAGLALALQAHDHGADVRVIDRRPEAFRPSRAIQRPSWMAWTVPRPTPVIAGVPAPIPPAWMVPSQVTSR